jgi:hypothetical protein
MVMVAIELCGHYIGDGRRIDTEGTTSGRRYTPILRAFIESVIYYRISVDR